MSGGLDRVVTDERVEVGGPQRRRGPARVMLLIGLMLGMSIAQPTTAQSELPGDDPAAWLDEASVQARRISGVGEELTQALQTKGALLATIAVAQETIGNASAAARNETLVGLCLRALAHDGEDGWVRAAQAKALGERGRAQEAEAALGKIANIDEQAAAWAWVSGESPGIPATQGVGQRFASQRDWFETQQAIRREAAAVARLGSLRDAQVWVEVLNDPAERAWASLGVAEGLAEVLPRAVRAQEARDTPVQEAKVQAEAEGESVVEAQMQAQPQSESAVAVSPGVEAEMTEVMTEAEAEAAPPIDAPTLPNPDAPGPALAEDEAVQAAADVEGEAVAQASAALHQAEPQAQTPQAVERSHSETAEALVNDAAEPSSSAVSTAVLAEPAVLPEEPDAQPESSTAELGDMPASDPDAPATESTDTVESAAAALPEANPQADTQNDALPSTDPEPEAVATPVEESPTLALAEPTAPAIPEAPGAPGAPEVSGVSPDTSSPEADSAEAQAATSADLPEAKEIERSPALHAEPATIPVVPNLAQLSDPAGVLEADASPEVVDLEFTTTKGVFTVRVHRRWAPLAADRFYALATAGYYHNQRFFRVVPGFVVQWGIHGYPEVAAAWRSRTLLDEPRTQPNRRGTVAFAAATQPKTRTTQVFINLTDNAFLDDLGFVPFGEITDGMDVVESLFGGYGETPSTRQRDIQLKGNAFLDAEYPNLDSVISVRFAPTP